ncbi:MULTISPECIES: alpha/beta hydrolase [unclassified Marinomonas]|uniref:alpha/beta hydrolase n=1 Tax=unclassified Marinomonas TaxID=196814 RepID=UPI0007AFCB7A|nr:MULTISPECIES: alpha/beta hydrolase [unclassified Marinomonas]
MDVDLRQANLIVSEEDDILGSDFKAITLKPAEQQICTLIHYQAQANIEPAGIALLYVHGYTDYFYQAGLAEFFAELGCDFYAVDLHGYGRSIRPFQADHNKNQFSNYYHDLDACLNTMAAKGVKRCVILGHSTGGLIVSRYLSNEYSSRSDSINIIGLILNSPFLSLPMPLNEEKWRLPLYNFISKALTHISLPAKTATPYAQTLHESLAGEWGYRLDWKPSQGSPLSFNWVHKIIQEQALCLQTQCDIPTLLCRSSKSTYKSPNVAEIKQGDGVLDVENMEAKAKCIFTELDIAIIDKGFHDIYLSPIDVRLTYLDKIKHWLTFNFIKFEK